MDKPLLPCPFCGSEAILVHSKGTGDWLGLLRPIIDPHNITSAEEYVVVSLWPKEWRAIRDAIRAADASLREGGPK